VQSAITSSEREAKGLSSHQSAQERIEQLAIEVCLGGFGERLQALVLTGSMARGEASIAASAAGSQVLGDAEFLLVFKHDQKADHVQARALGAEMRESLMRSGIDCPISFAAVGENYLRNLPPHIFGYELRTCGRVLCGDMQILGLVPAMSPSDIPREDAWRLLCNRLMEQFDCAAELPAGDMASPALRYRVLKLYLDLATSLLVFAGRYKPTYVERARELRKLAGSLPAIDLSRLASTVEAATRLKLHPQDAALEASFWAEHTWRGAISDARAIWRWQLEQLVGPGQLGSDQQLVSRWARRHSLRSRVRGWLYVMRECGWLDKITQWPQWLRCALSSSPRNLIYAAGSELLFALADQTSEAEMNSATTRILLPLRTSAAQPGWRQFAADIASNYHQFVEHTRA